MRGPGGYNYTVLYNEGHLVQGVKI